MKIPGASEPKLTPLASARLDLIRATAAFVVLIGHGRALFFVDFADVERPGVVAKIMYAATGLGHQAVMVFFVLSGFLIGRSIRKSVRSNQWSWGNYALSRLTRLYIVLIPAILLGAALDYTGSRYFGELGVYGGRNYAMIVKSPVAENIGPVTALVNLTFTQGILGPSYGSNGPLWSLSYEFWYYVLFPLIYLSTLPNLRLRTRVARWSIAALVAFFIRGQILGLFPVWLMGAGLAFLRPVSERLGWWLRWIGGGVFLGLLALARVKPLSSIWAGDTVLGLAFAVVVAGILAQGGKSSAPWYVAIAKSLSGMSYSLYLVHLPLLILLNAWLIGEHPRWQPGPIKSLALTLIVLAATAYAAVIAELTEKRTDRAKGWLAGTLFQRKKPVEIIR